MKEIFENVQYKSTWKNLSINPSQIFVICLLLLEKKERISLQYTSIKKTSMTQKSSQKITFMKSEHLDRPISWHEVLVGM